ncbi:MAG: helix-turn-helix transcriptional regulator [Alphaproteobacteria bacterium]|nr:helix-turn-helix transcriptional regulator [Alphaproteobacteria bacterium]
MSKPLHSEGYARFLLELRRAREERGMSQSDLAKAMGEHQTYVSKVETGVRRVDVVELQRWLSALRLSLTEFAPVLDRTLGVRHLAPSRVKARRRRE